METNKTPISTGQNSDFIWLLELFISEILMEKAIASFYYRSLVILLNPSTCLFGNRYPNHKNTELMWLVSRIPY